MGGRIGSIFYGTTCMTIDLDISVRKEGSTSSKQANASIRWAV